MSLSINLGIKRSFDVFEAETTDAKRKIEINGSSVNKTMKIVHETVDGVTNQLDRLELSRNEQYRPKEKKDRFIPLRRDIVNVSLQDHIRSPKNSYEESLQRILGLVPGQVLHFSEGIPSGFDHSFKRKSVWTFPEKSYRTLDSPGVSDDFWTHPIAWGSGNKFATILDSANGDSDIYIKNMNSENIDKYTLLCAQRALAWNPDNLLAFGGDTTIGVIDARAQNISFHQSLSTIPTPGIQTPRRVRTIDWLSSDQFFIGIANRIARVDLRARNIYTQTVNATRMDKIVCGLVSNRMNRDLVALGTQFGEVKIYDWRNTVQPLQEYAHTEACSVKALQWMEGDRNLLVSGSGVGDGIVKLYHMQKEKVICEKGTEGAQISGIITIDPKHFVVTLGSTNEDRPNLLFWRYQSQKNALEMVVERKHGANRFLGISKNPDEPSKFATINADETINFWQLTKNSPPKLLSTASKLMKMSLR